MSLPVRIIGVGNPLMGDDGAGVALVERLLAGPLPPGVEVFDGGTGGVGLLDLMAEAGRVILVDAVEMGAGPGTIRRFGIETIAGEEEGSGLSLHQAGLGSVLALGREMGMLPPLVLIGIQPARVDAGLGLSSEVEGALDELAAEVLREVLRRD